MSFQQNYYFPVDKVTTSCIQFIRDWFESNGPECNAIVGISGGKNSSVAAALCVEALGKDRVIGVLLPEHNQEDIASAYQLVDFLGIRHITMNIGFALDELRGEIILNVGTLNAQTKQNLPPVIRTAMLRAVAHSLNGRVVNTTNYSERKLGYFTKDGDEYGDFGVLMSLTCSEVTQIGHYLKLPSNLVEKVSEDGLCGKTDEDNFGFTYTQLDTYLRTGFCEYPEVKKMIEDRIQKNSFKTKDMEFFK